MERIAKRPNSATPHLAGLVEGNGGFSAHPTRDGRKQLMVLRSKVVIIVVEGNGGGGREAVGAGGG